MKKLGIILVFLCLISSAFAEDIKDCWVLCQPDSCVNIREKPRKNSTPIGEAYYCEEYSTDGKEKNGFLHLINVPAEVSEAWISKQYIVYDEPYKPKHQTRNIIVEQGKVAARRKIGSKVRTWLYCGDMVHVYAISTEWSVTDFGFVKTEFIDNGGCYNENFYDDSPEMTYEDD